MLSNQQIQNNWPQIKTQVLNKWNKLSESEVEKTLGNPKSLGQLVSKRYPQVQDFDKTYDKLCASCIPSSKRIEGENDIENRPATAPAAEAGLATAGTEPTNNTKNLNTHFSTPDEFYPSQDPTPSREDITLGRNTSSATKKSTAQAESISSEVSFNDAKKKI